MVSCLKGFFVALILALQPLEASAQKRKDDEMAEAIAKALERSLNEALALMKATNVDLHCIGKGVRQRGLTRENSRSHQVTEKMVRFFKTPIPEKAKVLEPAQWTIIIDDETYIHWSLREAMARPGEPRSEDLVTTWIIDREIGVSRMYTGEPIYKKSLDVKINRLTGAISFFEDRYSDGQLVGTEFFNGTCHKVTQKF